MTDVILYAQIIVFVLNIVVFCYLMQEPQVNYKLARVILLVAISVGAVINFGKVTVFTVIFSLTPFITLIKINKQHGNIKRLGSYFGRFKQRLQDMERGYKANHQ